MRRVKRSGAWGLYEWTMTGLLTLCATLLGICRFNVVLFPPHGIRQQ
jgi:hypothetical protein